MFVYKCGKITSNIQINLIIHSQVRMSKSPRSKIFILFTIAALLVLLGTSYVQAFQLNKGVAGTIEGNPVEVETPFDESHESLVRERREPKRYVTKPVRDPASTTPIRKRNRHH